MEQEDQPTVSTLCGGGFNDITHDDIEILNWIENSCWIKISINLPKPMWAFTPFISDNYLFIVGYCGEDLKRNRGAYKIPVAKIMASIYQHVQHKSDTHMKWTKLTAADHWYTALVPSSSPLVVVGGDCTIPTADIKMFDHSAQSWKKIESLSSPRSAVAIAALYNNTIIIIGGCSKGGNVANRKLSSLTLVELGQAELLH